MRDDEFARVINALNAGLMAINSKLDRIEKKADMANPGVYTIPTEIRPRIFQCENCGYKAVDLEGVMATSKPGHPYVTCCAMRAKGVGAWHIFRPLEG